VGGIGPQAAVFQSITPFRGFGTPVAPLFAVLV
jgi:hypothetical protein